MQTPPFVGNAEALVDAMGYWPSFHDANVLEAERKTDAFSVTIHLFAMTDEVDSAGYFALEKHHRIEVLMHGVQSSSLPATYAHDCLDSLTFVQTGEYLEVDFASHMGQDGTIVCRSVEIAGIVPCDSKGAALAPN